MKISGKALFFTALGLAVVGAVASTAKADAGGGGGGGGGGGADGGGGGLGGGGTPDPNPDPAPKPGGLGNLGGNVPVGKSPPANALTWTKGANGCSPVFWSLTLATIWARELGKSAPKNLNQKQLAEYGGRAAMGGCYPPPANWGTLWKESTLANLYEIGKAFLQGLSQGGALTQPAAQKILDDARAQLIAKGANDWELDPYLFPGT